jgi:glycosyltransferase involved in cell wall biosynthesis
VREYKLETGSAPKITVITACVNASRTIEQTLRSVLDQGYPNLEYIIIDGGSEDGTLEIVERYGTHLAAAISEPDNGVYDAFNKGLALATGDLIGILNADDFYAPWTFERVAEVYASHPEYDVFFGKVAVIDEGKKRWKVYSIGSERGLVDSMSTPHPAVFLPGRTYGKWGFFDDSYKVAGDWDYVLGLYMDGASFYPINEVLTAFRDSGVSSLLSPRQLHENRLVYFKYLDRTAALGRVAKMYLKYYGRRFLRISRTYDIYAAYRDRNLLNVEFSGEYGGNAETMWKSVDTRSVRRKG